MEKSTNNHPCSENLNLDDWRGSITLFRGFTHTRPAEEKNAVTFQEIINTVCPEQPLVTTDKKSGDYFIPCLLNEAPLVGNTLTNAEQRGEKTIGKMRSKSHVTEASFLVVDIDGFDELDITSGLEKMKADGLTVLMYSSYSHGNPNKPGFRVRLILPIDKALGVDGYRKAYAGFDQTYFGGQIMKADLSGANLYQQQGVWMTHPDWQDKAFKQLHEGGVASADFLVERGSALVKSTEVQASQPKAKTDYPSADAHKVADRCQQIGVFRDTQGADQSEPLWNACLGVVGHCEKGLEICQDWSSGHAGYSFEETQRKLDHRLKVGPTTCEQFKSIYPQGCKGCPETCRSPITLGHQPAKRDQQVKTTIPQSSELFEPVEPWPSEVNLDKLLVAIISTLKTYIVLSDAQALAVALWSLLTWVVEHVEVLPLLTITAPEKACGKTQLLDIIARICARSISVSNITLAALFRCVEQYTPTLLIDEVDTFIRDKQELLGLINAGHTRTSAHVIRTVGDNHEPKKFSVWSPKVLAGISLDRHLKDTTLSRSIVISMRRKLSDETVQRLRRAEKNRFVDISRKCARFALDHGATIAAISPELPDQLSDRQQDNWEPLFAIAQLAGPAWLEKANHAALTLSQTENEESVGVQLLEAIRGEFESKNVDKLSTADLIEALCQDEEACWASYYRDKAIIARQLGRLLKPFSIQSRTTKFNGKSLKGYFKADFEDVFQRYLPPPAPP